MNPFTFIGDAFVDGNDSSALWWSFQHVDGVVLSVKNPRRYEETEYDALARISGIHDAGVIIMHPLTPDEHERYADDLLDVLHDTLIGPSGY